ncbi:hypothetical protein JXC34_01895 [Candidatus Woesearchaeota archaeon]|nr:hypothetical protein [Candidatus Woesearchaeota archaeon]
MKKTISYLVLIMMLLVFVPQILSYSSSCSCGSCPCGYCVCQSDGTFARCECPSPPSTSCDCSGHIPFCGNPCSPPSSCDGGDDTPWSPPPPPPPVCGDGKLNQGWEICDGNQFRSSAQACKRDGNPCISCRCCGDGVVRGSEKCDLGMNNGVDANEDGVIYEGECRTDCTYCGDGVKQTNHGETCDLGSENGVELNGNDYIGDDSECRDDSFGEDACTFCGDGVFQQDYEFCDFAKECPLDECNWDNYEEWRDSGYYPGCRNDCTACGDGLLQLNHGESCDDTRPYEEQRHSSFDTEQHRNTCPGACVQPGFISGNYEDECTCPPEICNKQDDNMNCIHCSESRDEPAYFSDLCYSSDDSLWQLKIDKNENGIDCDCCLFGEEGCCDDESDDSCNPDYYLEGAWICDDGVDEGYSWLYELNEPNLVSAVLSDSEWVSGDEFPMGEDILSEVLSCADYSYLEETTYSYVYLSWNDLYNDEEYTVIEGTAYIENLEFTLTYKTFNEKISVEWYDSGQGLWLPILGCGPFSSEEKESLSCELPDALIDNLINQLVDEDEPLIRLIIKEDAA